MQFLLASVRANTGVKSGRYLFEARIAELVTSADAHGARVPQPKHLLRLGLTLEGGSLFLGDGSDHVCFDSEGFYTCGKVRNRVGTKFQRDQTVALLVNLQDGPNKNTVSLFVNGQRASTPQALPESMQGKPLFPTITYRNISLEANLGPTLRKPLPFTCHMIGGAQASDVVQVAKAAKKQEIVFPIGLPEQGYFDWVDEFLEKNPNFVELSDRKMLDWAYKSGLGRPRKAGSNDKPEMNFNNPVLDDGSMKRVIASVTPTLQRSFLIPELQKNLLASERAALLARFSPQEYRRKALVLMGEPPKEYVEKIHGMILAEKKVLFLDLEQI